MKKLRLIVILILFLAMSSVGWAAVPVIENPTINVSRSSIAYDSDFTQVAADVVRSKLIAVPTRASIVFGTTDNRQLLDVDGDLVLVCNVGSKLYSTTAAAFGDGTSESYTEILDMSGNATFTAKHGETFYKITTLKVIAHGVWVMVSSTSTSVDAESYIWKSADSGATWAYKGTVE